MVILALGASLVAIAVGAAQEPVSVPILLGAVVGVALSVCLWWLHFDVTSIAVEHRVRLSGTGSVTARSAGAISR